MKKYISYTTNLMLLFFFVIPAITFAQWSNALNISPNAVSALLNESMGTCIGVNGDTVHIVWADRFDNTHGALYYTRSVDSGLTWSAAVNITDLGGNAWNPAVVVSGSNIHVVWREIDTVTNKRNSMYKHSLDGGNTWGAKVVIDTSVADWPAVAVEGDTVYVANDILVSANPYNTEVFFLRSLDNGFTWGPHVQITNSIGRSEDEAIIAQGSHVHMSWNDNRGNLFKIYYKESDDYGVTWSTDTPVIPQYSYTTMVNVDGANVDVPGASAPVGRYQIHLAQSADTGTTWPPDQDVTNDTAHEFVYPDLVRDSNNVHLTYIKLGVGAQYLHSVDGGATWSNPYNLGNSGITTFVAYTGCILHIIVPDSGHINYFRNPTGNSGRHCPSAPNNCLNAIQASIQLENNVLCAGGSTGNAVVHAIGVATPFSYQWNSVPVQTDSALINVAAGNYTVTVTDANSCSATVTVTISQPTPISITGSTTEIACYNANNGTATTLVSGGTPGYQYLWNTVPQQTTDTAINLTPATYTVTITDANNCTAIDSFVVHQSARNIILSDSVIAATCGNNNGSATVTIVSGRGPFSYSWSNGGDTSIINNVAAGTYTVTVTGIGGCTATITAVINSSGGPVIAPASISTSCGYSNGSASVNITSGNGPYTYAWSTGGITDTITNLAGGTYIVTVTGGNTCFTIATITVESSSSPTLSTSSSDATCGNNNGAAVVTVLSGTGPFTYNWSNGSDSSSINNVTGGTYTVTVTDANGCTSTISAIVNATGGPVIAAFAVSTSCGNSNGSASVNITSGIGPYIYAWSNGVNIDTIDNLTPGTYFVTVTAGNTCYTIASVTVNASTNPVITIAESDATCGNNNGAAGANVALGAAPYTYAWNNGGNTDSISNLAVGNYSVTVTDNLGCTATATALVNSTGGGSVSITADKTSFCAGDSSSICATEGFTAYRWSSGQNTTCINVQSSGTYSVTATNNNNCSIISNTVTITVYPLPEVSFTVSNDSLFASQASAYQWYLNETAIAGATSPIYVALQSGSYSLQVTDSNGCSALSNPAEVTVSGINNPGNEVGIKVYPNPFTSQTTIEISSSLKAENVTLKIFNVLGQHIVNVNMGNAQPYIFKKGKLNSGIYFYQVLQKDKIIGTGKITIE